MDCFHSNSFKHEVSNSMLSVCVSELELIILYMMHALDIAVSLSVCDRIATLRL